MEKSYFVNCLQSLKYKKLQTTSFENILKLKLKLFILHAVARLTFAYNLTYCYKSSVTYIKHLHI